MVRYTALWVLVSILAAAAVLGGDDQAVAVGGPHGRDSVALVVGDTEITVEELLFRYAQLPDSVRRGYDARPHGLMAFLDDLAANLAVVHEAEALGLHQEPLYQRLMALEREQVLRDLYARRIVAANITEEMLLERYQAELERFTRAERVHVHYILVAVKEGAEEAARQRAEALRNELEQGRDFAEVARDASDDASRSRGGDLGWVERGVLVPEVETVAFELPVGELSPVFASPYGFHVVLVSEHLDARVAPYAEVRELLLQELAGEHQARLRAETAEQRTRLLEELAPDVRSQVLP